MEPNDHELFDQTRWRPLVRVVGREHLRDFMYMGRREDGEKKVFLYKHIFTRCYLNLDETGGAYRYAVDKYIPIDSNEALLHAFGSNCFDLGQDRFQAAIDVVELSRIYQYAGKIAIYFVVLDGDISLASLALACESNDVAQIKAWTDKGQVLVLQDPTQIPGLCDTSADVIRFGEAYLVKPDLKNFVSKNRKSGSGIFIQRILKRSLPAFLKVGSIAMFISADSEWDVSARAVINNRIGPRWLSNNELIVHFASSLGGEKEGMEFDLAIISNCIILQELN